MSMGFSLKTFTQVAYGNAKNILRDFRLLYSGLDIARYC